MNIMDKIKNKYDDLSRTQKKIADYILDNQEEACFRPLKKLSDEIGVSEATIIKFSKIVGCDSYFKLKVMLQENLKNIVNKSEKINQCRDHIKKDSTLSDIIDLENKSLQSAIGEIGLSQFLKASTIIEQSKKIYVIGEGSCRVVRDHLLFRLKYMGFNAQEFVVSNNFQEDIENDKFEKDVLYIVSDLPKYNKKISRFVSYLSGKNIDVIGFSESKESELYKESKVAFVCPSNTVLFFNSITSMIGVVTILLSHIALNIESQVKSYNSQ